MTVGGCHWRRLVGTIHGVLWLCHNGKLSTRIGQCSYIVHFRHISQTGRTYVFRVLIPPVSFHLLSLEFSLSILFLLSESLPSIVVALVLSSLIFLALLSHMMMNEKPYHLRS